MISPARLAGAADLAENTTLLNSAVLQTNRSWPLTRISSGPVYKSRQVIYPLCSETRPGSHRLAGAAGNAGRNGARVLFADPAVLDSAAVTGRHFGNKSGILFCAGCLSPGNRSRMRVRRPGTRMCAHRPAPCGFARRACAAGRGGPGRQPDGIPKTATRQPERTRR